MVQSWNLSYPHAALAKLHIVKGKSIYLFINIFELRSVKGEKKRALRFSGGFTSCLFLGRGGECLCCLVFLFASCVRTSEFGVMQDLLRKAILLPLPKKEGRANALRCKMLNFLQ